MLHDYLREQVIFDGTGVLQATFTAAATNIITSNAHGYTGGEKLQFTTADTLPAGLALATDYYVLPASVTTNTFKVSAVPDGPEVDITDAGTGAHTMKLKGKVILTSGFRHAFLSFDSSGTSTLTAKVQMSRSDTMPDFNAAQSVSNRWDYVDVIDEEDKASIDGDTGIALAGADNNLNLMVNTDGARWMTVVLTAWTQGKIRVGLSLSNG